MTEGFASVRRLCQILCMAASDQAEQAPAPQTFGRRVKNVGSIGLSGVFSIIPRIQSLRRRVWEWSLVRLAVAACATWLGWCYKHAGGGTATLVLSLLLFAFSLLVRTTPEEKPVDDRRASGMRQSR